MSSKDLSQSEKNFTKIHCLGLICLYFSKPRPRKAEMLVIISFTFQYPHSIPIPYNIFLNHLLRFGFLTKSMCYTLLAIAESGRTNFGPEVVPTRRKFGQPPAASRSLFSRVQIWAALVNQFPHFHFCPSTEDHNHDLTLEVIANLSFLKDYFLRYFVRVVRI